MSTSVQEVRGTTAVGENGVKALKPRILFLIDEIGGIAEGGTERQVLQLIQMAQRLGYEPGWPCFAAPNG